MPKKSLGDEGVTSSIKDVVVGKDVMNSREHYIDHSMLNKEDCLSPPCNERVSCDSIEPPPGFELAVTVKPSKKVPRRPQQLMEKRVTRSQEKGVKSNSQVTLESVIKLAEESLEIG